MSRQLAQEVSLNREAIWEITGPADLSTFQARQSLTDLVRPLLLHALDATPGLAECTFPTPFGPARLRRRSHGDAEGASVRLVFSAALRPMVPQLVPAAVPGLFQVSLPSPELAALGAVLVPCHDLRASIQTHWAIRWQCQAAPWRAATGDGLPPALVQHLAESGTLLLLEGPPGTGKTVHGKVAADDYCRRFALTGTLLLASIDRGDGTVGSLSGRVHALFDALEQLRLNQFRCLLLDEAEALVPVRHGRAMHHEDVSGVDVFLQRLDRLSGQPNTAVILTTNVAVDPAVRRRAVVLAVERPASEALAAQLVRWLPTWTPRQLAQAAHHAKGMTFDDLDRAMLTVYLDAVRN